MKNFVFNTAVAVFAIASVFAVLSVPCIDEKCLACNERVDPYQTAVSLRKLTVIEWLLDYTGDIHLNRLCPNKFVSDNIERGLRCGLK
jgi:hypothetical protein